MYSRQRNFLQSRKEYMYTEKTFNLVDKLKENYSLLVLYVHLTIIINHNFGKYFHSSLSNKHSTSCLLVQKIHIKVSLNKKNEVHLLKMGDWKLLPYNF